MGGEHAKRESPMSGTVIVSQGDSLSRIATDNGVTLGQLLAANPQFSNPGRNPSLIYPGEKIAIPGATFDKEAEPGTVCTECETEDEEGIHQQSVEKRKQLRDAIASETDPEKKQQLETKLRLEAHKDRNYFQTGIAPETSPGQDFTDENTGINWELSGKNLLTGKNWGGYHGSLDCYRGEGGKVDEIGKTEEYKSWLKDLATGTSVDPDDVKPRAQVCYDPDTKKLVTSGPKVGSWDAANAGPFIGGHKQLDMKTHDDFTPEDGSKHEYNEYKQGYPTP